MGTEGGTLGAAEPRARLEGTGPVHVDLASDIPRVLHDTPAAVLLVDLDDGTVIQANRRARELAPGVALPATVDAWGRAAGLSDPAGRLLSDASSPLSRVAAGEPITGEPVTAVSRTTGDGRRRALWVTGFPLAEVPDLHDRALLVLLELSDPGSAGAEQDPLLALRERAVVATDISFTISDPALPDHPLVWVNPAFTRTTGYTFEEVVGRNCRFLQGAATDPAAVEEIRRAIREQRAGTVTLLNHRKDGSTFWNQLSLSPLLDGVGRLVNYVGVQTDVTERVLLEEQRERALRAEQEARAEAERTQRRLILLAEATTKLSATLDVPTALRHLARFAVPGLAAWSAVDVLDEIGGVERVAIEHVEPSHAGAVRAATALAPDHRHPGGPLDIVLTGGQAQLVQRVDAAVVGGAEAAAFAALDTRSLVVVPLRARRHQLGALTLARTSDQPPFDESDLVLASDLARRAALAVDNARLYTRERQVAEALQRSLLPRLPDVPGLELAARYLPSSRVAEIGGDWYDVLMLPDGAVGLAIGDVMGHDLIAAAAMGQLRSVLRSYAWEGDPAAAVLDRMDRLVQGLHMAQLATAVYARLERDDTGLAILRYANAGHLSPLLQEPDGTVRYLEGGHSVLLGAPMTEERAEAAEALPPGTTVLLYTDGLVERRAAPIDEGLDWLADLVRAHEPTAGPRALNDALLASLADQSLADDVALLAFRVAGPA